MHWGRRLVRFYLYPGYLLCAYGYVYSITFYFEIGHIRLNHLTTFFFFFCLKTSFTSFSNQDSGSRSALTGPVWFVWLSAGSLEDRNVDLLGSSLLYWTWLDLTWFDFNSTEVLCTTCLLACLLGLATCYTCPILILIYYIYPCSFCYYLI